MKKKMKRMAAKAGAGILTAAALTAAAAYLVSETPEYRKAKAWAGKAKKEVEKQLRVARRMGGAEYKRVVDRAVRRYGSLEHVNEREIARVAREMTAEWGRIKKDAKVLAKMAKEKKR